MSILGAFGAVPSKVTEPLTEAAVAGLMGSAEGAGAVVLGGADSELVSFLPHPRKNKAVANDVTRPKVVIHLLVFMIKAPF